MISSRITCLKSSGFIGVSCSTIEVIVSPLMGPLGSKSFEILNNLDSSNGMVCRKALNSIFFVGDNFGFGYHLVYQSSLGVRHV